MKKFLILFMIQLTFGLPIHSQVNLDSLLVAYYPFNGNANDESGNGNDGTVTGAILVEDRFGITEGAYSFNGFSDYIEFGDVFNDVFVPFAISVWIYKEQVGPPNQNIFKTDNYPGTGTRYYYGLWLTIVDDTEQPTVALSYGDGGEPDPMNRRTKNSASIIYLDQWVHIVVNVNGPTDMAIYFNTFDVGGTYSGSGSHMVHSDWTANIGRNTLPPNVYFNGILDDLRIYDRLLTFDEITALYQEEIWVPPAPSNLQATLYQQTGQVDLTWVHTPLPNRGFLYYIIYRDGVNIDTSLDQDYTDNLPAFGTYEYTVTAYYDEGESLPTDPETVNWTNVGIEESINGEVKVYPNPVRDHIRIIGQAEITRVEIYNLLGEAIYKLGNINDKEVFIRNLNLNEGIYVIRCYSDGVYCRKITVSN